jgi:hypothetical protein
MRGQGQATRPRSCYSFFNSIVRVKEWPVEKEGKNPMVDAMRHASNMGHPSQQPVKDITDHRRPIRAVSGQISAERAHTTM